MEDDEEDVYMGEFEEGRWEWDDKEGMLVFRRENISIRVSSTLTPTMIGAIDFKEELDLLEQQRFRKRFERKTRDEDVVILQDIKDVALFTAPKALLTSAIINVLHLPATERFLRSLILYCQYFLQVSEEMMRRTLELQVKIRTERSDMILAEYKENLEDLRILVAKEYSLLIQGDEEFSKYHHMGPKKKTPSLMRKELLFFESLLRLCIQIVWLAMGRSSYNEIELEINRLFKSDKYNLIEHNGRNNCNKSLLDEDWREVLFGDCVTLTRGKLKQFSPLMDEIRCERQIDYRLLGLGVIKYPRLSPRLRYLEQVLIAPEEKFKDIGVSLGILGLQRNRFDTMLKEIKIPMSSASSSASVRASMSRMMSSKSQKSGGSVCPKLITDINIPEKDCMKESLPANFPEQLYSKSNCNDMQRRKWQAYRKHHLHVKSSKITSNKKAKFKS